MTSPPFDIVEWHRVSVLWRVTFLWLAAVGFIFVGMIGTGLHLFAPPALPEDTRMVAAVLGWPSAVLGPVIGIMGILRVLAGEVRALVVCRSELRFDGFRIEPVAWSDIHALRPMGRWPKRYILLELQRGDERVAHRLPAAWIGLSAEALCARIKEYRRRALLGVVRPI